MNNICVSVHRDVLAFILKEKCAPLFLNYMQILPASIQHHVRFSLIRLIFFLLNI